MDFFKRIKQSYIDISKPMLCDINIKYNNKNVSDLTKYKFNALYCLNALIICGKMNITNKQNGCKLSQIQFSLSQNFCAHSTFLVCALYFSCLRS